VENSNLKRLRACCLVVVASVFLFGCPTIQVADQKTAALVPENVAKTILAKHAPSQWINSPYVFKENICGGERIPINYGDLSSVQYVEPNNLLLAVVPRSKIPGICVGLIAVKDVRSVDVDELVTALNSLGADIKRIVRLPASCGSYGLCNVKSF